MQKHIITNKKEEFLKINFVIFLIWNQISFNYLAKKDFEYLLYSIIKIISFKIILLYELSEFTDIIGIAASFKIINNLDLLKSNMPLALKNRMKCVFGMVDFI